MSKKIFLPSLLAIGGVLFFLVGVNGDVGQQWRWIITGGRPNVEENSFAAVANVRGKKPVVVPAAPTGLTTYGTEVLETGRTDVLQWVDNSNNEAGFKIERSTYIIIYNNDSTLCYKDPTCYQEISTSSWMEIATVLNNVVSYKDAWLEGGRGYVYRLRAFNSAGNSDYSNTVKLLWPPYLYSSTPTPTPAPILANIIAPSNLTSYGTEVFGTGKTDVLNWTDNSNNEDGFKVERMINTVTSVDTTNWTSTETASVSWTEIASVGQNVTTFNDPWLKAGYVFYYRIRAFRGVDYSAYSNTVGAPWVIWYPSPSPSPSTITITAPSSITSNTTGYDGIITWTDSSSNETGFKVERKIIVSGITIVDWTEIASVGQNVTTYRDRGLEKGKIYSYRVRAFNDTSYSGYSSTVSIFFP